MNLKLLYLYLDYLLDNSIGWFLTNGNKQEKWKQRIEWKKINLENERKNP